MSHTEILDVTLLSLRIAALATLLMLPPAIALAHVLARRDFPGKALVEAAVALPMVLPPVAVGLGLLLLLGREGPVGRLLTHFGVDLVFTGWAAVLAAAVVGFPLLVRACSASFAEIDPRHEQIARSLGLTPLRTFFRVSLPMARRGVLYGALLAFARGLGEFGATAIVAGITPGRTETLALGIYSRIQYGDDRGALILCGVSFGIALTAMALAEIFLRRREPQHD